MGSTVSGNAVVLTDPARYEVAKMADVLAPFLKRPFADIAQQLKRTWGLIGTGLSDEEARALADRLSQAGYPASVIPGERVVDPRPVNEVGLATPAPDGLKVRVRQDVEKVIPWAYVALIAVVGIRTVRRSTMKVKEGPSASVKAAAVGITLATGIPIPIGKAKEVEKVVETGDTSFSMDVVLKETFIRIRIAPEHINFGYLGDKKSMSSFLNFKTLLNDLKTWAPTARFNLGATILNAGRPVAQMPYDSAVDLDNECRWLLTLVATGSSGAAGTAS